MAIKQRAALVLLEAVGKSAEEFKKLPKPEQKIVLLQIADEFGLDLPNRAAKRSFMRSLNAWTWKEVWTVKQFLEKYSLIDFSPPEFQREFEAHLNNPEFVIDILQAIAEDSLLIQSLHLRRLDEKNEEGMIEELLDGCQRANSIILFWYNKLDQPLPTNFVVVLGEEDDYREVNIGGIYGIQELNDPNSSWVKLNSLELGKKVIDQMENAAISIQVYDGLTDDNAAELFRRLNNSLSLFPQQIRNSHRGAMCRFSRETARGRRTRARGGKDTPPHKLFTKDGVDQFVPLKKKPKYIDQENDKMDLDLIVAKCVNWAGRKNDNFTLTQGTTAKELLKNYTDQNWKSLIQFDRIKQETEKTFDLLHESFVALDSKNTENECNLSHKFFCAAFAVTHSILYRNKKGQEVVLKDTAKDRLVKGIKDFLKTEGQHQEDVITHGIITAKKNSLTEFGLVVRRQNTKLDWQIVHDKLWQDMLDHPDNYGLSVRTKTKGFKSEFIQASANESNHTCAICNNREYDGRPLSFGIKYPDGESIVGGHDRGRSALGKGGSLKRENCYAMHSSCNKWQGENDLKTARSLYRKLTLQGQYIVPPLEKKVA